MFLCNIVSFLLRHKSKHACNALEQICLENSKKKEFKPTKMSLHHCRIALEADNVVNPSKCDTFRTNISNASSVTTLRPEIQTLLDPDSDNDREISYHQYRIIPRRKHFQQFGFNCMHRIIFAFSLIRCLVVLLGKCGEWLQIYLGRTLIYGLSILFTDGAIGNCWSLKCLAILPILFSLAIFRFIADVAMIALRINLTAAYCMELFLLRIAFK